MIKTRRLTVETTAVRAKTGSDPVERVTLIVKNKGIATIYWGNENVTAANGFELESGKERVWELGSFDEIYLIGLASDSVQIAELSGDRR